MECKSHDTLQFSLDAIFCPQTLWPSSSSVFQHHLETLFIPHSWFIFMDHRRSPDPTRPSLTFLKPPRLCSPLWHICQPPKTWQPDTEPLEWDAIRWKWILIRVTRQHRHRPPFIFMHAAGSWEGAERFRLRRRLHLFPAFKHLKFWCKQPILQINTRRDLSTENRGGGVLIYLRQGCSHFLASYL